MWFWSAGATNRKDLRQAVEYSRFIVETTTASPVFEFINIEPSKYWESLLFLDEQNFAGIEVSVVSLSSHPTNQRIHLSALSTWDAT